MEHSKVTEDVLHFQVPSKLLVIQKLYINIASEVLIMFDSFTVAYSF